MAQTVNLRLKKSAAAFLMTNLTKARGIEAAAGADQRLIELAANRRRKRIRLGQARPASLVRITMTLMILVSMMMPSWSVQAIPTLRKRKIQCPDEIATTGYYRNYSYGFSIWIPRGLKGYWNSARCVKDKAECVCMGDHGRWIPIDHYSYIQVFVGTQNSDTVKESIEEAIQLLQQHHADRIESFDVVSRTMRRLNGIHGVQMRFRYKDVETGQTMLENIIICPPPNDRDHGGFLYFVTLAAPEAAYLKRKPILDSIIMSWRFKNPK